MFVLHRGSCKFRSSNVDIYLFLVLIMDHVTRILAEGGCTVNHIRIGPTHFVEKCTFTGKYVTICNTKWGENEAKVACRGAGLCGAELCQVDKFEIILTNTSVNTEARRCDGDEQQLDNCVAIMPSILHNCNDRGFRVICHRTAPSTPLPNPSYLAGIVIGTLVAIVVMAIILSFALSWARKRCVGM